MQDVEYLSDVVTAESVPVTPAAEYSARVMQGKCWRPIAIAGYAAHISGEDNTPIDLREADLQGADLRDADLRGADLQYANLRAANLEGANLQGANLQGAEI